MPFYYYDKLKQAVPIDEAIAFYTGVPVDKKTGKAHCPSRTHADEHASVQINIGGSHPNTCYCHSCNRPFNLLQVVKETCDLDTDAEAAERLISDFSLDRGIYCKTHDPAQKPVLTADESRVLELHYSPQDAQDFPLSDFSLYLMIMERAVCVYQELSEKIAGKEEDACRYKENPYHYENLQRYSSWQEEVSAEKEVAKAAYDEKRDAEKEMFDSKEDARAFREGDSYKRKPFKMSVSWEDFWRTWKRPPVPPLYTDYGYLLDPHSDAQKPVVFASKQCPFDAWVIDQQDYEERLYYSAWTSVDFCWDDEQKLVRLREDLQIVLHCIEKAYPKYLAAYQKEEDRIDAFFSSPQEENGKTVIPARDWDPEEFQYVRSEFLPKKVELPPEILEVAVFPAPKKRLHLPRKEEPLPAKPKIVLRRKTSEPRPREEQDKEDHER